MTETPFLYGSAGLRGFSPPFRWEAWCSKLDPADVAEFPQPAHNAEDPTAEQLTACTLRVAPNDSESFIVLHLYPPCGWMHTRGQTAAPAVIIHLA
jgi:hypothetical protein